MKDFLKNNSVLMKYYDQCLDSVSDKMDEYLKINNRDFNKNDFDFKRIAEGDKFITQVIDLKTGKKIVEFFTGDGDNEGVFNFGCKSCFKDGE